MRHRKRDRRDDMAGKARQHVAKDDAPFANTVEPRGGDEFLGAQRQEAAANDAGELCPTRQRQDDRDHHILQRRRPVLWQRRGHCQPDRDRRQRQHKIDHPLQEEIDAAAVISRDTAEHDAEHEREEDTDEADRQRDLRALDRSAEDIAPKPVGAEQKQWRRLVG